MASMKYSRRLKELKNHGKYVLELALTNFLTASDNACWDNAVVERFFGSLKHDWVLKVAQPARQHMKNDVAAYMRYYNLKRLHSANGDKSPVSYENSFKKVSGFC